MSCEYVIVAMYHTLHNRTQEVIQLSSRLKHKSDQVNQLQLILSEKGHEDHHQAPPLSGKKSSATQRVVPGEPATTNTLRLKENVAPS